MLQHLNGIYYSHTYLKKKKVVHRFSLTSLLSSFNLSMESSVLLASIKSPYFSVEYNIKSLAWHGKKEDSHTVETSL